MKEYIFERNEQAKFIEMSLIDNIDDLAIKWQNKIYDLRAEGKKFTFEDIDKIIYITLKEVARDQRYNCIDAFNNDASYGEQIQLVDCIQSIIQNAQIKVK